MKDKKIEIILHRISIIGSAIPILWLCGVFLFFIRARNYLGYWPNSAIPDPKSLPFIFHHWVCMVTVFPLISTFFILPIIWLIQFKTYKSNIRNQIIPYGIGAFSIAIAISTSGTNFVTWFLD